MNGRKTEVISGPGAVWVGEHTNIACMLAQKQITGPRADFHPSEGYVRVVTTERDGSLVEDIVLPTTWHIWRGLCRVVESYTGVVYGDDS